MAYMDDMALEREKTKQAMIAGKQPLFGADTSAALHALGVKLGVVPPGTPPSAMTQLMESLIRPPGRVRVDETKPLQVQPLVGRLQASLQPQSRSDDSIGANLSAGFSNAKDAALQRTLQAEKNKPPVGGQQPGAPAAPGPPPANTNLRAMANRGRAPRAPEGETYKADLAFLNERGAHASVVKDGKIVSVPVDTPGAYGAIDPELAARLRASAEAFEKENPGKKAKFGEFSRGEDVQKIYHDRYKSGQGGIAAAPGRSGHQHGRSGDLPTSEYRDWLYKGNKDKFGLHFPVKGDAPHVEVNPRYQGPAFSRPPAAAATPAPPAATTTPPAATTAPAAATTAPAAPAPGGFPRTTTEPYHPPHPGHTPGETPPVGGIGFAPNAPAAAPAAAPVSAPAGGNVLAEQRAPYKAQVEANPAMRDTMAAIMLSESSTPGGQQGVAEAMMNRVNSRGLPFANAMDPAYHRDYMVDGGGGRFQAALNRVRNDPQLKAQLYALQDKAFAGSNVSNLATDYSSGATAAKGRADSTHTFTSPDGQSFFRKDVNPTAHGPTNVAKTRDWHSKTTAAMATPAASAPAGDPNRRVAPSVQDGQTQPPSSNQRPQAAPAPAPGTSAPTAAAPVVAPAPAAAPSTPAAAAPTAKPAPIVNPAHAILDTKVIDLVKRGGTPEQVAQVPGFIGQKTLREALNTPMLGGQIAAGVKPYLGKMGVTQQQFDAAVKEGPPKAPAAAAPTSGKRSEAPAGPVRYAAADTGTMTDAGPELPDDAPTLDPLQQKPVQNEDGSISTVRTIGIRDNDKEVNIPTVPAEGGRVMSDEEAVQRYNATGKHLGKFDTVEEAGAAAEKLHQDEAARISQQPKGEQPAMTPELAAAFLESVKDQSRVEPAAQTPTEALPVTPAQPAGPIPNAGSGGLSLAPPGLNSIPTGAMPGTPGSQGGTIAMAGMLPPIQNATFSSPLLDTQAAGNAMFGSSNLSPIPPQILNGWGWGGGSSIGAGFDWGGGGGFSGGGFSMPFVGGIG